MERIYIREYRILRGIRTQDELARLAGIPRSTLGEIERHKMRGGKEVLEKIAAVLGITREQLYIRPIS